MKIIVTAVLHVMFFPTRLMFRQIDKKYIEAEARIQEAHLDVCFRAIEARHGRAGANRVVELMRLRDFSRSLTAEERNELAFFGSGRKLNAEGCGVKKKLSENTPVSEMSDAQLAEIIRKGRPKRTGVWFDYPYYRAIEEKNRRIDIANLKHLTEEQEMRAKLASSRLSTAHDELDAMCVESVKNLEGAYLPARRK